MTADRPYTYIWKVTVLHDIDDSDSDGEPDTLLFTNERAARSFVRRCPAATVGPWQGVVYRTATFALADREAHDDH